MSSCQEMMSTGEVTVAKVVTLDTLHLEHESVEFFSSTKQKVSDFEQAVHIFMADTKK